jgi:hypothetical protein
MEDMMEYLTAALEGHDAFVSNPVDFIEGIGGCMCV